jgi:hypothetical protein
VAGRPAAAPAATPPVHRAAALAAALAQEPQEQAPTVVQAAFADGRLWLLTSDGALAAVREHSEDPQPIALSEPGAGLCVSGGRILVLTGKPTDTAAWTLRRRDSNGWTSIARIPARHEAFAGLECAGDAVTVLTERRLVEIRGQAVREIRLSKPFEPPVFASLHTSGPTLFLGLNRGEWGGGLRRIDRKSGKVSTIESNRSGKLCGGPLNTDCDPVQGVVDVPWKPGCVAAAVGLVHFAPHGRLVEICGAKVKRIYYKSFEQGLGDYSAHANAPRDDGEPFSTVAFFGLVRRGDTLWAIGIDGVYRLRGPGAPVFTPLPKFRQVGGFHVSFAVPGVVLVLTDINRRASLSGSVPLMVPR